MNKKPTPGLVALTVLLWVIPARPDITNGLVAYYSFDIYRFQSNGTQDYTFVATLSGDFYTTVTSMLLQPGRPGPDRRKVFRRQRGPRRPPGRLNGEQVPVLRVLGLPGPAGFPIEVTGEPAGRYAFEVSSNLVAWSDNVTGTCRFTNAPAPLAGPHVYRMRRAP